MKKNATRNAFIDAMSTAMMVLAEPKST